jgi:hypothetical protein
MTHASASSAHLLQLREALNQSAPESIDKTEIETFLALCWHQLSVDDDGGMEGYKLRNRAEKLAWNSPYLTFRIERHGATVNGSVYAEVQSWSVNVDEGTAIITDRKNRQVDKKAAVFKVEPLADEIGKAIIEHAQDGRLSWKNDNEVRILVGKIIPTTNSQTTGSRRKRFWAALDGLIKPHGWTRPSTHSEKLVRGNA